MILTNGVVGDHCSGSVAAAVAVVGVAVVDWVGKTGCLADNPDILSSTSRVLVVGMLVKRVGVSSDFSGIKNGISISNGVNTGVKRVGGPHMFVLN